MPGLCAIEPLVSRRFVILASRVPLSLSASCPIVSVAFLFVCSSLSTSYSLSNRLLDAIIGPPSPPLSSVSPLHFYAICPSDLSTSHSLDRSDLWLIMKIRRMTWFLFRGKEPGRRREGWNHPGQSLSPLADYERVGRVHPGPWRCFVWAHTLVSIIIKGSRCLGHGCDIRAPCACLQLPAAKGLERCRRRNGAELFMSAPALSWLYRQWIAGTRVLDESESWRQINADPHKTG